jgi:hypothetical protein
LIASKTSATVMMRVSGTIASAPTPRGWPLPSSRSWCAAATRASVEN